MFFTSTIFGVKSPCFGFRKTIWILSFPGLVVACALPKFSLKCIAATRGAAAKRSCTLYLYCIVLYYALQYIRQYMLVIQLQ